MFAKRYNDLPISQRVGDIIRVHRAYVGTFKNVKQFTANIFFNSSWALFSPLNAKQSAIQDGEEEKIEAGLKAKTNEREFFPFLFYGKSFSFEKSETKTIKAFRDWISKSFAKHHILSNQYIT